MTTQKYNNELALGRLAELPSRAGSVVTALDNFSLALSGLSAAMEEAARAAGKICPNRRGRDADAGSGADGEVDNDRRI